jgi:cyclopropane fatty-acyl-phospholipid synthase-like methyltransferase
LRSKLYDFHINNTHILYKKVIENLPEKSKVLEVGIGNGSCVEKNADLIKNKGFEIDGIDIDTEYLDACNERIVKCDLTSQVTAKEQDLLKMDDTKKYDYIFFMESYPVIPVDIMKMMMDKCKSLLASNGKVIFVHNLVDKKNWLVNYIKPRVVNIPLVQVDFGRLTTHAEFDDFIQSVNYEISQKTLALDADINTNYNIKLPNFINTFYTMKQYSIECVPK